MKILLVDPLPRRRKRIADHLAAGGHDVRAAPDGLFALTMIERATPDLLLTRSDAGDMSGDELRQIVAKDPSLTLPIVFLVSSRAEARKLRREWGEDAAEPAAVWNDDHPHALAERAHMLAQPAPAERQAKVKGELEVTGAALDPRTDTHPLLRLRRRLEVGEVGDSDFVALTEHIAQRRLDVVLSVECGDHAGVVVFEDGRVRHASYRAAEGLIAFEEIFQASRTVAGFRCRYEDVSASELKLFPDTLGEATRDLLRTVAKNQLRTVEIEVPREVRDAAAARQRREK